MNMIRGYVDYTLIQRKLSQKGGEHQKTENTVLQ